MNVNWSFVRWTLIFGVCLSLFIVSAALYSQRAHTHGAVAVGLPANIARQGVAFGYAVNQLDQEMAQATAIEQCKKFAEPTLADQCAIVKTFRDECLAVAMDKEPGTRGFGWAIRPTRKEAEDTALNLCKSAATPFREGECRIVAQRCDGMF